MVFVTIYIKSCLNKCFGDVWQNKCYPSHTYLQVFHWYMFSDEFYRIYKRIGSLKYLILSWISWFMKLFFLNIVGPMNCGLHTCYGDGTEITNAENKHVRDITWKNMIFNRWQKGDLIMIDNYRVSYGRQVCLC